MTPTFNAIVRNGHLELQHEHLYRNYLQSLEGKRVKVKVTRYRKERTLPQNSYYWGVVLQTIAYETGHEPDELHGHFRAEYLTDRTTVPPIARSTTRLTTAEMGEYIEKIKRFAAMELQIYIPDANETQS